MRSSYQPIATLGVLAACVAAGAARAQNERIPLRRVEMVAPGTVIDDKAPKGWSHLIIKSRPRLTDAEQKRVSSTTAYLSSLLVTTMLADVQAENVNGQARYYLNRVGVGVGTRVGERDTILSPDTQARFGARLGLLARVVLSKAYEKQQECRLVAASRKMALLDTPATMLRGNRHRSVIFRYLLLLEPDTGELNTLVWLIDLDDRGNYSGPMSMAEWLAPNKVDAPMLRIDDNEFTLGVASDRAAAVMAIPQGQKQIAFPAEAKEAAGQASPSGAAAGVLEAKLREALR